MKFKLVKCELNSIHMTKINILCDYFGWEFHLDHAKSKYLLVLHDDLAYVQLDPRNRLFYICKSNEFIYYVDDMLNIIYQNKVLFKLLNNKFIKALLYYRNSPDKLLIEYGH